MNTENKVISNKENPCNTFTPNSKESGRFIKCVICGYTKGCHPINSGQSTPISSNVRNYRDHEVANNYAKTLVPNPNSVDAPYWTTEDRYLDLRDAFIDGAEWQKSVADEKKWTDEDIEKAMEDAYDWLFDGSGTNEKAFKKYSSEYIESLNKTT